MYKAEGTCILVYAWCTSGRIHKNLKKVAVSRNEAKEISKEKSFAYHALEFGLCVLITIGCYSKTNQGRNMIRFLCEE